MLFFEDLLSLFQHSIVPLFTLHNMLFGAPKICHAWPFSDSKWKNLGIAVLMRRLLTSYAVSFNQPHKRHGQLF